ncbi:MAG: Glu/Leu/Phe/Val dehydrogenase dimerization domain-containing protein [Nannocystales bacterium]
MLFDRSGPGWNYEELVVLNDRALGLHAIIAIDSTRRGPAFGGVRRLAYGSEGLALSDALALASAMTFKTALAGLPAGGAKTVVIGREGLDLPEVYRRLGSAIEHLGGRYVCGPDLGTGDRELGWIRTATEHVNPLDNDAGRATARGVMAGLRAVWSFLDIEGRGSSVAIQGCGAVGLALIRTLRALRVRVVAADTSAAAVRAAKDAGAQIVAPSRILETPCDVLIPCAVGGIISAELVPRLRCRAICGSANNQLRTAEVGLLLHAAGIAHAPDVIVSAGAVIEGVLTVTGAPEPDRDAVAAAIDRIEATTLEVLETSVRLGQPPAVVAVARAQDILGGR